jgi:hypothetical protein
MRQDSQSHEAEKYGNKSCGTRKQKLLCWRGPVAMQPNRFQSLKSQWPEGSHSRQTAKYGQESGGTRNQESSYWLGRAAI